LTNEKYRHLISILLPLTCFRVSKSAGSARNQSLKVAMSKARNVSQATETSV
jgi:hypothetical protein